MNATPMTFTGTDPLLLRQGVKTQDRRTLTRQNVMVNGLMASREEWARLRWDAARINGQSSKLLVHLQGTCSWFEITPRYGFGHIFYVKESYITGWPINEYGNPGYCDDDGEDLPEHVWYRADDNGDFRWLDDSGEGYLENVPWESPPSMPRALARTFLRVVGVRFERLEDISTSDCMAEGISPQTNIQDQFAKLWDTARGRKPGERWEDSPVVIVYELEMVEGEK